MKLMKGIDLISKFIIPTYYQHSFVTNDEQIDIYLFCIIFKK